MAEQPNKNNQYVDDDSGIFIFVLPWNICFHLHLPVKALVPIENFPAQNKKTLGTI